MKKLIFKLKIKLSKLENNIAKLACKDPDLFCLLTIVLFPFIVIFGIFSFIYRLFRGLYLDEKNN